MTTLSTTKKVWTFKVDYEDRAGTYAGWFLLSSGNPVDASAYTDLQTVNNFSMFEGGSTDPNRTLLLSGIEARLALMFGPNPNATWTATLQHSITPAVLDDTF